jgi:hypothetical protein
MLNARLAGVAGKALNTPRAWARLSSTRPGKHHCGMSSTGPKTPEELARQEELAMQPDI